jgi:O-antigen ligase
MQRLTRFLLWIFVVTVPLEYVVQIGPLGSISRIAGVLALGASILNVARRKRVRSGLYLHGIMAAFVLWGGLSYFWSLNPELTLGRVETYAQVLLMLWLVWEVARDDQNQTRVMHAYVFGAAIAAIGTIAISLSGGVVHDLARTSSFGFDPNDQALTLSLAVPMAWTLATKPGTGPLASNLYRGYLGIAVLAVLLTGSRGGMLALIPALSIIVTSSFKLPIGHRVALVVVAGLAGIAICSLIPDFAWQRVLSIQTEFQGGDFSNRKYIWEAGVRVFLEHPVFGIGAGAFAASVASVFGEPILAHNTFLSVLVEQGIIGFSFFLLMLGSMVYLVVRLPSGQRNVWITSLVVWAVGASSLTWEYRKPTWLLFALIAGHAATRPKLAQDSIELPPE